MIRHTSIGILYDFFRSQTRSITLTGVGEAVWKVHFESWVCLMGVAGGGAGGASLGVEDHYAAFVS